MRCIQPDYVQQPIKIYNLHIYNDLLHITQQKTEKHIAINIGKLKEIIDKRITEENELLFTKKQGTKVETDLSLMIDDERARKQLGHTSARTTQHYIRKEKPLNPTK